MTGAVVHASHLVFLFMLAIVPANASKKFLSEYNSSVNGKAFKEEVMNAVGSMLGCGGRPNQEHMDEIKAAVTPMWRTLPKTYNRIDRRSLRYLVHRYFMQKSSLLIRGFEPSRAVNDSNWGAADILSQMVPAYVESVLESKHNTQHGFSLQDAVDVILMLDGLIFDSESSLLEGIYKDQSKRLHHSLSFRGMKQVLEEYIIKWMIEADPADYAVILANRTLAAQVLPHYHELVMFVEGRLKEFEYRRHRSQAPLGRRHADAWDMKYSFDDAHAIVGGITRSFQSYWQSECDTMKSTLVDMDTHSTGRVPLAKFYGTGLDADWRFGESEAYLRELGALDESSRWRGPQVIIPNYLQATSNCIVSTSHYLVCCVNECESLLGEIESGIDAPTASPNEILAVVQNMTVPTSLDKDEPPHLDATLDSQLKKVASNHGGVVPLHGRLFAQWLHYVFPRECPFPHKVGVVSSVTPSEYGDQHIASKEDMRKLASNASAFELEASLGKEELQWMSQWTPEEELLVDYTTVLRSSWQGHIPMVFVLLFAIGGVWGGILRCGSSKGDVLAVGGVPHSHWV